MAAARKRSSSRLSRLASKYVRLNLVELNVLGSNHPEQLLDDIRSLAASVLSQDEVKGK